MMAQLQNTDQEKADELNTFFTSVFLKEDLKEIPTMGDRHNGNLLAPRLQLALDPQLIPGLRLAHSIQLAPRLQLALDPQLISGLQLALRRQVATSQRLARSLQLALNL